MIYSPTVTFLTDHRNTEHAGSSIDRLLRSAVIIARVSLYLPPFFKHMYLIFHRRRLV
jgi:hypothetical protein